MAATASPIATRCESEHGTARKFSINSHFQAFQWQQKGPRLMKLHILYMNSRLPKIHVLTLGQIVVCDHE